MTISWYALENYQSGPNEYAQDASSNAGRLRVSGSTPNIGHGPLEVRTADVNNLRRFVCGTDTFTVSGQNNFSCPNGENPRQIIFQQIYRKNGNTMTRNERMAGSMTYHSSHGHYHVNDWVSMSLRLQDPNEPDPRQWPKLATGAKIGFCLMDYGSCTYYNGHCRDTQEYGQGTTMTTPMFPNNGMYGGYGCGTNVQGISVGRTDIYSEGLDMMWVNLMPGLCNGNYWIVAEVDPTNVFQEEDDDNNWTAIPFNITQQRPANSGGTANIGAPDGLRGVLGGTIRLVATPGTAYLWSTGATTRSIDVSTAGNYSVQVTAPCGNLVSGSVAVTFDAPLDPPVGTGASAVGPASVQLSASGSGGSIVWYDQPTEGMEVGTGATYDTPVLNEPTPYYAAVRSVVPGSPYSGAKTDRSGGALNSSSVRQWTIFDAYEPFILESVKVYATGNGDRHFALVDNVGNLIEERYVYVADGTHTVELGFQVPAGVNHRITAFDDNTEIILQLHRDNSGVSYPYALGTLGAITGSTGGAGYYYYLYDWQVSTPDLVKESARTMVMADVTEGVEVQAFAFLNGPYIAVDNLMNDALRSGGHIPATEPYTALGYAHVGGGGGEDLTPSLLSVTGPDAIVDWVLLELRDAADPSVRIASRSALIKRSGAIVSPTGTNVRFAVEEGNYHIALRHRNHLGCMTAVPVALTAGSPFVFDLRSPSTPTWGTEARKTIGAQRALWEGNVVFDTMIKYTGSFNDRDPILTAIGGTVPTATVSGYYSEDVNMDGIVRYTGSLNDRDPVLVNIGGTVPTTTRQEQLP